MKWNDIKNQIKKKQNTVRINEKLARPTGLEPVTYCLEVDENTPAKSTI